MRYVRTAMIALSSITLARASARGEEKKPPKPRVRISKETTYLTKPLRKDGYVDYAAALNLELSKGVTAKNNAVVLLLQAFGPSAIGKSTRKPFFAKLAIPVPPKKGNYVLSMDEFAKQVSDKEPEDYAFKLFKECIKAIEGQWSPTKYPRLAAWVSYNDKLLVTVIEASKRSKWYCPNVHSDADESVLMFTTLPMVQVARETGYLLRARALLRVRQGRIDEAQRDLLACHRLARLVAQGPFLIERLVGISLEDSTCKADEGMLQSGRLAEKQLAAFQKELDRLPPLPRIAETVNRAERFSALDSVLYVMRNGFKELRVVVSINSYFDKLESTGKWFEGFRWRRVASQVDWNEVFKSFNAEFDRLHATTKFTRFADWKTATDKYHSRLHAMAKTVHDRKKLREVFSNVLKRERLTATISKILISLLMPAITQARKAEFQATTRLRLTRIAVALERYRKAHGKFPAKLDSLKPKFLKTVPDDVFTEKPFIYKPEKNGYLLYSIGPNLKDDGGKSGGADKADDIFVRMQLRTN